MKTTNKTIGVYWGRFNPVHKGHMAVIKKLSKKVDRLTIAVGSAQLKNEKNNPFSGAERARMIRAYLDEEGITCRVVAVNDQGGYYSATRNLVKKCGRFDILFLSTEYLRAGKALSHRRIVRALAGHAHIEYFERRGRLSATLVRDRIAHGENWEHLTGKSVADIIRELDGIERIRKSYATNRCD